MLDLSEIDQQNSERICWFEIQIQNLLVLDQCGWVLHSDTMFSCSYWVFNLNNSIIDDNAMSLVFRRLYSVLCVQLVQEY